ncbi:SET and MYND domain-containing protein DDB_G0273589-like [Actinia tenebrosa]|uniref:SET and MYND domain-containing protein DDB_G0273589-like n=1 Tax=Actinia tenebrosa TaxID=6105 RepID=A0A6P8HPI4_ACTTE|nr:SET and MYND domain-containing protein DDB_G0273589-like [Actinia tenebrosa]
MSFLIPPTRDLSRNIPSGYFKMADCSGTFPAQTTVTQTLKCSYCDKTVRFMKLCTQCRAILYCSRECQIKDWPSHKKKCTKVKFKTKEQKALKGIIYQNKILEEKENKVKENHGNSSKVMNDEKQLEQQMENFQNIDKKQENILNNGKILSSSLKKESEEESPKENCTSKTDTNDEIQGISQWNGETVTIFIRHNKEKKKVDIVKKPNDNNSTFQQISDFLRIPVGKLKLIHKGKMIVPENANAFLTHGAMFLAFGEASECEDGLDKTDIDILIKQLNVDRNMAVKALRRTGTLLDAIFDIGNKG